MANVKVTAGCWEEAGTPMPEPLNRNDQLEVEFNGEVSDAYWRNDSETWHSPMAQAAWPAGFTALRWRWEVRAGEVTAPSKRRITYGPTMHPAEFAALRGIVGEVAMALNGTSETHLSDPMARAVAGVVEALRRTGTANGAAVGRALAAAKAAAVPHLDASRED